MKKRLYKSVEALYSYVDKRDDKTYGSLIKGKQTTVHLVERLQGDGRYNGDRWQQVICTVDFLDLGFSITLKSKSTYPDEALYVEYALSLMEEDSLEEFYKTVLLLASIHLNNSITSGEDLYQKYLRGEYSYPLNKTNVKEHLNRIKTYKKVLSTIDVQESDLNYIESFKVTN